MGLRLGKVLLENSETTSSLVCKFRMKMINKEFKCQLRLDDGKMKPDKCENLSVRVGDFSETVESSKSSAADSGNIVEKNKIQDGNSDSVSAQCEFCGKRYKNRKRLKDHLRFCHPKVYHKCTICSQKFPKKWVLNIHMRKHSGENPYTCFICGQRFISNSKLLIHSNFHHKEKELSCTICDAFGFYTKQDLGNHMRTKHTKERVFQCVVCNKSFMSSSVYYQHRFIHTNIRKYSCEVCSRSFKRWLTLHNHLRIHKNELPFSCDVCRQAFRQRGDMKKHKINQHSNLQK